MIETETHAGNLKLIGGWLCLNFINTVDWRTSDHPREWLTKYADFVSWSRHASILADSEARSLLRKAELHPKEANAILERAIILRETLYRIFSAIIGHSLPSRSDIIALNTELSKARARMWLAPTADGRSWTYAFEDNALDRPLWSVAHSAADLLVSDKISRISRCSTQECGWLFLDLSRNRSRKWCDMEDCGNRAKARRHYRRKRAYVDSSSLRKDTTQFST